ncbi:Cyanovirin-N [Amylostereum chailletii]|nr:Cyanovirin-N [Amylostereum chailletii]
MAFTLTSRSISLHDTILSAECRTRDGKWKISYLDLNQYLSNRNGSFKLHGTNYFHTAESVSLDGHTLRASLRRIDGEYGEALLDLTLCVDNVDGTLRFKKP